MRKKEIEESKYLGGDMEHTHLVKGLDYSLLHKIRSELEKEKRIEAYVPHPNPHIQLWQLTCLRVSREEEDQEEVTKEAPAPAKPVFRTPLAQSVHHLLFEQNDFMIKHRYCTLQPPTNGRSAARALKPQRVLTLMSANGYTKGWSWAGRTGRFVRWTAS